MQVILKRKYTRIDDGPMTKNSVEKSSNVRFATIPGAARCGRKK
jgi:hypothetical protein